MQSDNEARQTGPLERLVGRATNDDFCPDCFRNKAHSADQASWGYCEKWWAVRDKEARIECDKIAARIADRYRPNANSPAKPAE